MLVIQIFVMDRQNHVAWHATSRKVLGMWLFFSDYRRNNVFKLEMQQMNERLNW